MMFLAGIGLRYAQRPIKVVKNEREKEAAI